MKPSQSRFARQHRVAVPSIRFVPWAALASCWPLPQQLLPVSAAGGGRSCCIAGWVESRGREGGVGTPLPASGPAERPCTLKASRKLPRKVCTFLVLFWCQKRTSLGVRLQYQKAPRTSGGNAGRFGDTGCMPYASGWGCAAEDWAAMNSAASSGMSSRSSSLPMSTLSGGFLNRISYRIGTIYRVIRVA